MPKVTIEGHITADVPAGYTLLTTCTMYDVPMESACGGFAGCNSCRVVVLHGANGLSAQVPEEDTFLDGPAQRLGCQARVLGDVTVRLDPGI